MQKFYEGIPENTIEWFTKRIAGRISEEIFGERNLFLLKNQGNSLKSFLELFLEIPQGDFRGKHLKKSMNGIFGQIHEEIS